VLFSNDSTVAIAEHVGGDHDRFVKMMNTKAAALGMLGTRFRNTNGYHDPNHYTTAYDLALLTKYALGLPRFNELVQTRETTMYWIEPTGREEAWGCRVFNHYGMTEMGLGGGVECAALAGYHLREADLLFEVVDPESGEVLPEGEEGEVVFTTLTRRGMPLIRYRTGDIARFIPEPCPCGTVLKRLSPVKDRVQGRIVLTGGGFLSMSVLDEVLFAVKGVANFKAAISNENNRDRLEITVQAAGKAPGNISALIEQALYSVPVISHNSRQGKLILAPVRVEPLKELWPPQKRVARDHRDKN
jgi:hypothetical protein